jgi:hypothetical protein
MTNAAGPYDAAQTNGGNGDLAAVKRLLLDFKGRLQTLDCDLYTLYAALDGPPGAVAQLADEICDREWYVDGIDIRDLLPASAPPAQPAGVTVNAAASPAR